MRRGRTRMTILGALALVPALAVGCGGGADADGHAAGGAGARPASRGAGGWPGGPGESLAAVPVEVATAQRRPISVYIETNGTLEAENEVDVVARLGAPVVELLAEEGMEVVQGQVLARLDDEVFRNNLEIARVTLNETKLAFERAKQLAADELISGEEFERANAAYESAKAQFDGAQITLGYTEVRAPFAGLIVRRYVDTAQNVSANEPLFRLSDFTPLLCPIQIPERDLPRVAKGQTAYLTVESWQGERFPARVLRISPIVDAATGTIKVTLEVDRRGRLLPGMFARVFVETERRDDALVVPSSALSLESIGDTIYVVDDGKASRREVELGFREGDRVEVVSGVAEGEQVVVVGQDGLSDGTPVEVMRRDGASVASGGPAPGDAAPAADANAGPGQRRAAGDGAPDGRGGPGGRGGRPDLAAMSPEQLERAKQFMRSKGMTETQIDERIARAKQRAAETETN